MNTHDIEAFVAVVETGSISAAAARLNLTQPGITRRVQNLEASIGTGLLDRMSKPLKPTSTGREAYELGRRVLRSVEDLVSGLSPDGAPAGEFRIGITPAIGDLPLAQSIDVVRTAYPGLALRVSSAWSPALVRQVEMGLLHAAAITGVNDAEPPAPLQAIPLGKMELVVAASRHLRLPRRPDLEAVSAFPWIVNPEGCGTRRGIAALFEAEGLPFQVAVESVGTELKLSLAARGIGLALVQSWAVARSAYRDDLVMLRVSGLPNAVNSSVIHGPALGKLAPAVELFRTAFAASLRRVETQPAKRGRKAK
ncbi:MAG TPA: LysR family transcriptional regulator [Dongiaceae bacterium]|jgi:DNA-binding transcriptional LysR family regulator|nr:LysR family transcriptional regulator [Dongiaceae bacterium]